MIPAKYYYLAAGACIEGAIWCAMLHWGGLLALFLVGGVMNWTTAEKRSSEG